MFIVILNTGRIVTAYTTQLLKLDACEHTFILNCLPLKLQVLPNRCPKVHDPFSWDFRKTT